MAPFAYWDDQFMGAVGMFFLAVCFAQPPALNMLTIIKKDFERLKRMLEVYAKLWFSLSNVL